MTVKQSLSSLPLRYLGQRKKNKNLRLDWATRAYDACLYSVADRGAIEIGVIVVCRYPALL